MWLLFFLRCVEFSEQTPQVSPACDGLFPMSTQWFYTEDGKQQGPISSNELKSRAANGTMTPDELVWKEGMSEWVPARRIKGLFTAATASASPPPLPPMMDGEVSMLQKNAATSEPESDATPDSTPAPTADQGAEPRQTGDSNSADESAGAKPTYSESILGGIVVGIVVSVIFSVFQRLFYGTWMDLWSLMTSSILVAGAMIALIASQQPSADAQPDESASPEPSRHEVLVYSGFALGAVFGVLYGLWFGGIVSQAFYGSCLGASVAGISQRFASVSVGHLTGLLVVTFAVLHFTGFTQSDGKKLAAFRAVVNQYHSFPSEYATAAEREAFAKELNQLQERFFAIDFDPKKNPSEAKAICDLHRSEIEHKYRGYQYNVLEEHVREIYQKFTE